MSVRGCLQIRHSLQTTLYDSSAHACMYMFYASTLMPTAPAERRKCRRKLLLKRGAIFEATMIVFISSKARAWRSCHLQQR